MTRRDALAAMPDDALVPVGWVRPLLKDEGPADDAVLTTGQAHRHWPAYSAKTWRTWADDGRIVGAWKDDEAGPWRLPIAGCRAQLARVQQIGSRRDGKKAVLRGPWKSKAAR